MDHYGFWFLKVKYIISLAALHGIAKVTGRKHECCLSVQNTHNRVAFCDGAQQALAVILPSSLTIVLI